jgi:hypothetical protein
MGCVECHVYGLRNKKGLFTALSDECLARGGDGEDCCAFGAAEKPGLGDRVAELTISIPIPARGQIHALHARHAPPSLALVRAMTSCRTPHRGVPIRDHAQPFVWVA